MGWPWGLRREFIGSLWDPMGLYRTGAWGSHLQAHGAPMVCHGGGPGDPIGVHLEPMGTWGANGVPWGPMGAHRGHYIKKLPMNRPTGRYVIIFCVLILSYYSIIRLY